MGNGFHFPCPYNNSNIGALLVVCT